MPLETSGTENEVLSNYGVPVKRKFVCQAFFRCLQYASDRYRAGK